MSFIDQPILPDPMQVFIASLDAAGSLAIKGLGMGIAGLSSGLNALDDGLEAMSERVSGFSQSASIGGGSYEPAVERGIEAPSQGIVFQEASLYEEPAGSRDLAVKSNGQRSAEEFFSMSA